jgi:hypothetical protein
LSERRKIEVDIGINAVFFEDVKKQLAVQRFLMKHLNERLFQFVAVHFLNRQRRSVNRKLDVNWKIYSRLKPYAYPNSAELKVNQYGYPGSRSG